MSNYVDKLSSIISGWKNYLWKNVEVERLAAKRAMKCAGCDHAIESKYEVLHDHKLKEIQGMVCDMCLCPLSTKLRSEKESCPLEKW